LAVALTFAAMLHHCRREAPLLQARAEVSMTLAIEQDFLQQLERARPLGFDTADLQEAKTLLEELSCP
jgi:predicted ATPase